MIRFASFAGLRPLVATGNRRGWKPEALESRSSVSARQVPGCGDRER